PFVWTYGYRTVEILKDGTIENRLSTPKEVEEYKNSHRIKGAANGKTPSFEERLSRLENTTKEMLAESIAGSMNKAKARKDFDEEFDRVASRKQAYRVLAEKEKSEIKNNVRGSTDKYLATSSSQAQVDAPLTPQVMAGAVNAISGAISLVGGRAMVVPAGEVAAAPAPLTPPAIPTLSAYLDELSATKPEDFDAIHALFIKIQKDLKSGDFKFEHSLSRTDSGRIEFSQINDARSWLQYILSHAHWPSGTNIELSDEESKALITRMDDKDLWNKAQIVAKLLEEGKIQGSEKDRVKIRGAITNLALATDPTLFKEYKAVIEGALPIEIKVNITGQPAISDLLKNLEDQGILLQEVTMADLPEQHRNKDLVIKPDDKYVFIGSGFYDTVWVIKVGGELRFLKLVGGALGPEDIEHTTYIMGEEVSAWETLRKHDFGGRIVEYRGAIKDDKGRCIAIMTKGIDAIKVKDALKEDPRILGNIREQIKTLLTDIERETGLMLRDENPDNFLYIRGENKVVLIDGGL
ncbi:MAG: hypothetical protein NT036_03645, partial [Candidatus Omnitrophica bacterium]|nr:hypothetical protein [Candidatus Omnitrophota bacterium]